MAKRKQSLEYIALRAEYVKLAKRADQRMVRLEELTSQEEFIQVTQYAYKWAQTNLKHWSKKKKTHRRFNADIPKSMKSLEAKLNIVRQFLDMKTSTKSGIVKMYKTRAKTINEKYGTSFTWEDMVTYFTSDIAINAEKTFGSVTALRVIGEMQKKPQDVIDAINESKENTVIITGEKNIQSKVTEFLKENGLELLDLL